jgi:hypothetical protein
MLDMGMIFQRMRRRLRRWTEAAPDSSWESKAGFPQMVTPLSTTAGIFRSEPVFPHEIRGLAELPQFRRFS